MENRTNLVIAVITLVTLALTLPDFYEKRLQSEGPLTYLSDGLDCPEKGDCTLSILIQNKGHQVDESVRIELPLHPKHKRIFSGGAYQIVNASGATVVDLGLLHPGSVKGLLISYERGEQLSPEEVSSLSVYSKTRAARYVGTLPQALEELEVPWWINAILWGSAGYLGLALLYWLFEPENWKTQRLARQLVQNRRSWYKNRKAYRERLARIRQAAAPVP